MKALGRPKTGWRRSRDSSPIQGENQVQAKDSQRFPTFSLADCNFVGRGEADGEGGKIFSQFLIQCPPDTGQNY
jgi:hypothetical protein